MVFRVFCETLVTDGRRYAHVALWVEKGRIVSWESYSPQEVVPVPPDVDARGKVVSPGLIDIHVHGGGGRDLMEGSFEAVQAVAVHLLRYGVTGFLVTPPHSAVGGDTGSDNRSTGGASVRFRRRYRAGMPFGGPVYQSPAGRRAAARTYRPTQSYNSGA